MIFETYPSEDQKKPELFHYIRTLGYLYQHNYSEDIQIAWLLHDAFEDTALTYEVIQETFWTNVADIVQANTKNTQLPKTQVLEDIVIRCVQHSEDALIVKMADVYDNFLYYVKDSNLSEIERCKKISWYISELKPWEWDDVIFDRWTEIQNYKI